MLKTPPLQTATATIDTLCGRLQSATLLEDRRGAILGLRSFAKQYPASVASGSVRELIATLRRDGLGEQNGAEPLDAARKSEDGSGDVDTIRLVLETLLMLFNPDADSPEAGDEIAFFMADEFSVRQDNIILLLNLLDPTSPYADYYSRKYSVDILSAICAARPERLQECILSAPLGVSRLVGILDDGRDAVRNAGLLLLVDLTNGANEDLRKIVAFEEVFAKVFALIRMEGGLAEAGITAQDCLSLLANLVKGSSSNQTMFRESGCIGLLTQLLRECSPPEIAEAPFIAQNREKSSYGVLQLLRLFLVEGESSTTQNQNGFFRAGAAQILIDLGFSPDLSTPIRKSALNGAAGLIAKNTALQEAFAGMTVASPSVSAADVKATHLNGTRSSTPAPRGSGVRKSAEKPRIYIIEALLDLTLDKPQAEVALRAASCSLIQAYLAGHTRVRTHFLQRAISGHAQNEAAANVLTTLTRPNSEGQGLVFASCIVQDLIVNSLDAKIALASVQEGNESEGEDVLSFIQTVGSHLQESLQAQDERLIASFCSLLAVLLWDFALGVDDLLAEGSSLVQTLASTPRLNAVDPLIGGVASVLLGTVYEFSTKDSPVPRRTLAPLLTQKLTRSKYLDALTQLRRDPAVRDFDLVAQESGENLLCETFVDLFSIEYARLRKAIDKDPGLEVLPASAADAGVDRDILDDLRQQIQIAKAALATAQEETISASQKHEQELLSAHKDRQTAKAEIDRIRRINEAMQQGHESELEKLTRQHERQKQDLQAQHQQALTTTRQETQHQIRQAVQQADTAHNERLRDVERRLAELGNAHRAEQAAHATTRQQHDALAAQHADITAREATVTQQHADLVQRLTKLSREHQQLQTTASQAQTELARVQEGLDARAAEAERLAAQAKELREELQGKDAELATERSGFADLEKELESAKSALAKAKAEKTKKGKGGAGDAATADKVALLEKELETAKAEGQSAKDELESMLLVMGDIEGKRDAYRAKIKELGGEVSDDDEDDDEEEDEEEGDEEEGEEDEGVD